MIPDNDIETTFRSEQLSTALGAVYDAALDPALWSAAIEACCAFLNCSAGIIGCADILHLDTTAMFAWGYAPAFLQRLPAIMKINPLSRPGFRLKVGEVGCVGDAMSYEEFYSAKLYEEWGKPQGLVDIIQTMIERTGTTAVVMGCARHEHQGRVDQTLRQRLTLLAPHLRRAILIGKTIDRNRVEAATFGDTIDGLAAGVFLVDLQANLIHANLSGEAMLASADFLHLTDGVLRAAEPKANRALREVLTATGRGEAAIPAHGNAIAMTGRTGERFSANVLPLASGRRRSACVTYAAAAAIFIRSTTVNFPGPIQTVASLYQLTPGETRILFLILEVHGVPAAAAILGLSVATVKTHLHNVFRKTGASNQADLVTLVAGYTSPLAESCAAVAR